MSGTRFKNAPRPDTSGCAAITGKLRERLRERGFRATSSMFNPRSLFISWEEESNDG